MLLVVPEPLVRATLEVTAKAATTQMQGLLAAGVALGRLVKCTK